MVANVSFVPHTFPAEFDVLWFWGCIPTYYQTILYLCGEVHTYPDTEITGCYINDALGAIGTDFPAATDYLLDIFMQEWECTFEDVVYDVDGEEVTDRYVVSDAYWVTLVHDAIDASEIAFEDTACAQVKGRGSPAN